MKEVMLVLVVGLAMLGLEGCSYLGLNPTECETAMKEVSAKVCKVQQDAKGKVELIKAVVEK